MNMLSMSDAFLKFCAFVLRTWKILPQHVAVIPDNNRTYSRNNNSSLLAAYMRGQSKLVDQLKCMAYLGISHITVYLLSSRNLERNEYEKKCVFDAIYIFIQTLLIESMNCRFKIIGEISQFPAEFQESCFLLINQTKCNDGTLINLALNYSGKEELIDIATKILTQVYCDDLSRDDVTENSFDDLLYAKDSKNVDLLIRTSKDKRLSEFLLWQNIRSYLHYIDICWPEITEWHLLGAIFIYQHYNNKK